MMGEQILSFEDSDSILDVLLTEQQTEAAAADCSVIKQESWMRDG